MEAKDKFALCPLLPSLASNIKCSPSLFPSTEKGGLQLYNVVQCSVKTLA